MKCDNCSHLNPEEARFCQNCGAALMHACSHCGTANAIGAKFCKHCGARLVGQLAGENSIRSTRRKKTSPPATHDKTKNLSKLIAGERKSITILFTDIVGSTTLAEGLDPEDWKEIVAGAHRRVGECVLRYAGYIAQLLGDGVLAFFGAPTTHEDDPIRAVQTALDIQAAIHSYSVELADSQRVINFQMRVGINSGPVVVDLVGIETHMEYSAFGDAVNLAARMQSAATPGKVLLSENTYRSVAHAFDFVDLGEIDVKGKSQPIHVYEVKQPRSQPLRMRRPIGLESKMVGRDEQLQSLMNASQSVTRERTGRVIIVVGEPGLGKSRLIGEWRKIVLSASGPGGAWIWAEGHCLSYSQTMPYYLVRSLLRSIFSLPDNATTEDGMAVLSAAIQAGSDEATTQQLFYLSKLLEMENGADPAPVHAQSLQAQFFAALRSLLISLAGRAPLCLILEDIHWADPSSIDLLSRLLSLTLDLPLVLCLVARPERQAPGWKLIETAHALPSDRLTELTLTALSEIDSRQLIANLLTLDSLPSGIRNLILTKSEGNPFFIEEVLRLLIDRGAILHQEHGWVTTHEIQNIEVPDSMQRLLLARIDRLVDNLKRTLRVASVVGRQFLFDVLQMVLSSLQEQVDRAELMAELSELEDNGLIESANTGVLLEYMFRHALLQEAAYAAVLKNDRRTLHQAAAHAIQTLFPHRSNELASTIAFHYEHAEDWEPALHWLKRAAELASEQWALSEAVDLNRRALAALAHRPAQVDLEFTLRFHLAQSMMLFGLPRDDTLAEIERCLGLTLDRRQQAEVHFQRGQLLHIHTSSDLPGAERDYTRAIDLLGRDEGDPLYNNVLAYLGYLYRYQGRTELSIETLRHALDLAIQLDSIEIKANASIFLSGAYLDAGYEDEALAACLQGLALAEQIGNLEMIGRAHSFCMDVYISRAYSGRGSVDEALPHINEMRRHGREYGTAVLAGFGADGLAAYNLMKGNLEAALAYWRESTDIWLRSHAQTRAAYTHAKCGQVQLELGEETEALKSFELARQACGSALANLANFYIGLAFAGAGFDVQACTHLQAAFETADSTLQRQNWISTIRTDPEFTRPRSLPGLAALLDRYEPEK